MSALHRAWLADQAAQAAQAHEGPQTAEDWGNDPTTSISTRAA